MDSNPASSLELHFEILPKATKSALDFLSQQQWLAKTSWYLAGGTALALQVGHRKSVDLDFFNIERQFKSESVLLNFANEANWQIEVNEPNTIYGVLYGAKISFIAYPFFIPALPFIKHGSVQILQPADIAVMKVIAISQRGKKRDFFDLYWYARNFEPLEQVIRKLPAQYPTVAHDYHHILKSLIYFADGEDDPAPEIFFQANWGEVKSFFQREVPKVSRQFLGLE